MLGSHNFGEEESGELAQDGPETTIIGTDANVKANLAPETERWANEKNLRLVVQPSHEATAKLNKLTDRGKKVAALIHITCQVGFTRTPSFP